MVNSIVSFLISVGSTSLHQLYEVKAIGIILDTLHSFVICIYFITSKYEFYLNSSLPPQVLSGTTLTASLNRFHANGIVNVSAKDLGTGKEQHITITAGSNMSEDEINRAVKEAAEFEAQDKKRKEGVDARNEADSLVFQTENAMKEVGDQLDASLKSEVEADIASLKTVLDATANADTITDAQLDELKAGREKLMNSAQQLFAKVYEKAQGQGGAQAGPNLGNMGGQSQAQNGNDDDIIDADYRQV